MKKYINKLINLIIRKIGESIGGEVIIVKYNKKNPRVSKSSARYLSEIARYIEEISNVEPKNVFEVGANYGQDANFLKNRFGIDGKHVYVFEPHPELCKQIKNLYNFNCYQFAVSDKNKKTKFHAIDLAKNNGISSLKIHRLNNKKNYHDIEVQSIRMDRFISKNKIKSIDFLKIDVEGLTYEVLSGFGKRLNIVKSLQIETEFLPIWKSQKTWGDIYKILSVNNFQLVDYKLQEDGIQGDSLWIQKKYIEHKIYNISSNKWENTL